MKIETIPSPAACKRYIKETYLRLFTGKETLCAKIKNARIRAVRKNGCTVYLFRTYHPSEKTITVHAIMLSDAAVDAMQILKNKLQHGARP